MKRHLKHVRSVRDQNGEVLVQPTRIAFISYKHTATDHTLKLTYAYKPYNLKDVRSHDPTPLKLYAHVTIRRSRDHTT